MALHFYYDNKQYVIAPCLNISKQYMHTRTDKAGQLDT